MVYSFLSIKDSKNVPVTMQKRLQIAIQKVVLKSISKGTQSGTMSLRQFTNEDVVFMLELGVRFFFYPGSPLILNYRVNEIVMLKGSVPYKSLFESVSFLC